MLKDKSVFESMLLIYVSHSVTNNMSFRNLKPKVMCHEYIHDTLIKIINSASQLTSFYHFTLLYFSNMGIALFLSIFRSMYVLLNTNNES